MTATQESTSSLVFQVWNPLDCVCEEFATEKEALACCDDLFAIASDDGLWAEEIGSMTISKVTHVARHTVNHVRGDMSDDEWHDVGGTFEAEEMWTYSMREVSSDG